MERGQSHEPANREADICLVLPAFSSVHFPHLGTAILKTACQARGLTTRILYGNLLLAAGAGLEAYDAVCEAPMRTMLGERLYRPHAYPPETALRLPEAVPLPDELQAISDDISPAIGPALDLVVEQVLALRPRILGVSSTFEQNLACAAVARRVKEAAPDICIVMGGANVAWPICDGLAAAFPWIDHFFAGESDGDFPDFCERLVRYGERPGTRIIRSEPIRDMRTTSAPDFSDFFAALRPLQAAGALPGWLPRFLTMETSRGCWWGAKNHCTFCGLNGEGMAFRDKPAPLVMAELAELAAWGVDHIHLTDNIMPHHYLTDLLPALAEAEPRMKLFYEIKANLSEAQVDVLARGRRGCDPARYRIALVRPAAPDAQGRVGATEHRPAAQLRRRRHPGAMGHHLRFPGGGRGALRGDDRGDAAADASRAAERSAPDPDRSLQPLLQGSGGAGHRRGCGHSNPIARCIRPRCRRRTSPIISTAAIRPSCSIDPIWWRSCTPRSPTGKAPGQRRGGRSCNW